MNSVAITLNGVPVSGRPGMTILELAGEVGVKIPTLCHEPSLKPVGACRICLVEEEKSGRLLASCVTPIAPGMVINTASPAVIENRKVIVKLMLASHPESCLLCDKGNRCQLRAIAAELGIGALNYYPMPHFSGMRELNPFIRRDLSKCILCSKCIRADQELVVVGALDYMHRGFDAIPATTFDGPLETSECTFCGTCVSVCPTGALSAVARPHVGTTDTRIESICSYCGCGCNIFLETSENRVIAVTPGPPNDLNGKTLCVRGRYGTDYIHHRDRLERPLIRKDGELTGVSWDEALNFAAEGLRTVHARHGPEALAFFGSSKCTNEENYLFQKIARAVFGTNNIDNGARLYSGASVDTLPFGAATNPLRDIEYSDLIFVVGSNPSASHPLAGYGIKRAVRLEGARLILIDPRKTELASFASAWLPIRPGSDHILVYGLLREILDRNAIHGERSAEIDDLATSLWPYDRAFVSEQTGCPPHLFDKILQFVIEAKLPAIVYGHGITRRTNARKSIRALTSLALLKGSLGKQGGGIYPLDKENNGQGAWDMGLMPDRLPGHQSLDSDEPVRRFESLWGRPVPKKPGLTFPQAIKAAESGALKAMYIMGENPARSFPGAPGIAKALSRLDFLIVQDLFPTETVRLAHVVFPAASFAEKDGTFTNLEGRVQRIRKAIEPVGQSRPDGDILCALSGRLGYPPNYSSPSAIMEEIESLVPNYSRMPPHDLSGLRIVPAMPPALRLAEDERFLLIRGSVLYRSPGGTRSSASSRLNSMQSDGFVEINPADALDLGLNAGDAATLVSDRGEARMILTPSDSLPRAVLFCPASDANASALVSLSPDSAAEDPCRVRIVKES